MRYSCWATDMVYLWLVTHAGLLMLRHLATRSGLGLHILGDICWDTQVALNMLGYSLWSLDAAFNYFNDSIHFIECASSSEKCIFTKLNFLQNY